jgi:hypothetical protein
MQAPGDVVPAGLVHVGTVLLDGGEFVVHVYAEPIR